MTTSDDNKINTSSDQNVAFTINLSALLTTLVVFVADLVAATLIWAAVGQTTHYFRFVEGTVGISVLVIGIGYAITALRRS